MADALHNLAHSILMGLPPEDAQRLAARMAAEPDWDDADRLAEAWRMGASATINAALGHRICRICGCWEMAACDPPCSWADDDLCTACDLPTGDSPEAHHHG